MTSHRIIFSGIVLILGACLCFAQPFNFSDPGWVSGLTPVNNTPAKDPNTNCMAWYGMTSNSGFQASFTNAFSLTANNAPTSRVGVVSREIFLDRAQTQTLSITNGVGGLLSTNGLFMITCYARPMTNLVNITMCVLSKHNGPSSQFGIYIEADGRTNNYATQPFAHYDVNCATNGAAGQVQLYFTNYPYATNVVTTSAVGGLFVTNVPVFFAFGIDGTNLYFSMNGSPAMSTPCPGLMRTNGASFIVGALNNTSEAFHGGVSEIAVYAEPFNMARVASNYNNGSYRTFTSP